MAGFTPAELAKDIEAFLSDRSGSAKRREQQKAWVDFHSWPNLSERLSGLIRGEVLDSKMPDAWRQFP